MKIVWPVHIFEGLSFFKDVSHVFGVRFKIINIIFSELSVIVHLQIKSYYTKKIMGCFFFNFFFLYKLQFRCLMQYKESYLNYI